MPAPGASAPSPAGPLPAPAERSGGSAFISYRRDGGAETARLLRYELMHRGWKAFLDVEDLKAGRFDDILLQEVARADNFLLILSPGALANCAQENDWVRKEIRQAIDTERNIVPLLKEKALSPAREELPQDIEALKQLNYVEYSHEYYDATIKRLFDFFKLAR